jgi:hypothetical protein
MIDGTSVVLQRRPPPMSRAPAETASSVLQCRHTGREPVEKRALEIRMDIDPLHRHTDLAGMVIATLRQRLDQPVEVGTPVDDRRGGATMLQRATRPRRQLGAEIPADAAGTDKAQI